MRNDDIIIPLPPISIPLMILFLLIVLFIVLMFIPRYTIEVYGCDTMNKTNNTITFYTNDTCIFVDRYISSLWNGTVTS
jgi:hypothetical protein